MVKKFLPLILLVSCSSLNDAEKWASIDFPKSGLITSYGTHSAGCIQGAVKIESSGSGFKLKNPESKTRYAHPNLISYIKNLAGKRKYKLLIGDLSQPRGGPIPGGHSSHQNGLDVDIDYPSHTFPYTQTLYRAVRDVRVERIFVHFEIKKALCDKFKGRDWLNKIRPWWGHREHFHVRLKCPEGMSTCENPSEPTPKGDGCDETLDWWYSEEARAEVEKMAKNARSKSKQKDLPERCEYVLSEDVIHRIPNNINLLKEKSKY